MATDPVPLVEHASDSSTVRLGVLEAVSVALARAVEVAEVIDVITDHAAPAFGGVSCSICLPSEDGSQLELVQTRGYEPSVGARWHSFPIDAPVPAADAFRTGAPVVLTSKAERDRRYPALRDTPSVARSVVVLPLQAGDAEPAGVLSIGFAEERALDGGDLAFLHALASICAQNLDRARLLETANRRAERLAFLAEAGAHLSASLDYETTLASVARLAVPRLTDVCAVAVLTGTGGLRPVAIECEDAGLASTLRALAAHYPEGMGHDVGLGLALRTGEALWYPELEPGSIVTGLSDVLQDGATQLGITSAAIIPLVVRDTTLGILAFANVEGRPLTEGDFQLGRDLAARAAVAVENARLFTERDRLAELLQQSLLPADLPEVPGVELAARYLPALVGGQIGGDFYDVVRLGGGRWLLVVGDVCGKGPQAARHTALVRHAIRSAAIDHDTPAAVLRHVNQVVRSYESSDGRLFCTAALVRLEVPPAAGSSPTAVVNGLVAVAGHPMPIMVGADGVASAVGTYGTLLGGLPVPEITDVAVRVEPGGSLVLYTDGVTERRHEGRILGEEGLRRALVGGRGAEPLADRVTATATTFTPAPLHDDLAVLVASVAAAGVAA